MVYLSRVTNPFRRIAKSLRSLKTFKESFAALLFGFGGLIAGSILVKFVSLIFISPWTIIMYPLVLSSRGAINGVLSGRLGTGLQTRLIEPRFRKNTRYYYVTLAAVLTLSLISSLLAASITFVIAFSIFGVTLQELDRIFLTCIITKALSVLVTAPFSSSLGFLSYRKGLDPDVFVYPISATIADIWTTISYVLTLGLVFWYRPFFSPAIYFFGFAFIVAVILLSIIFRRDENYWMTLKEACLMILTVIPLSAISGFALSKVRTQMRESLGILTVYPALINTLGAAGAIFGSLSTTKLALGLIKAKINELKSEFRDLSQIGSAVLIMYVIYGVIASSIGGRVVSFAIILLSLIILFPIIIGIAFSIGILAFIKGLDPDNFIIPFETTLTDCLLTVVISILIVLF